MKSFEMFIVLFAAQQQILGEFINPCSNTTKVTPFKDFDIEKFSGKEWYYIDLNDKDEEMKEEKTPVICASHSYGPTSDPYGLAVRYSFHFNQTGKMEKVNSTMLESVDHDYPALFHYGPNGTFSVMVLETDYNTWATFYGCYIGKEQVVVPFAIITSSKRTMEKGMHDKLVSDVEKLGFAKENFIPSNQKDCD